MNGEDFAENFRIAGFVLNAWKGHPQKAFAAYKQMSDDAKFALLTQLLMHLVSTMEKLDTEMTIAVLGTGLEAMLAQEGAEVEH